MIYNSGNVNIPTNVNNLKFQILGGQIQVSLPFSSEIIAKILPLSIIINKINYFAFFSLLYPENFLLLQSTYIKIPQDKLKKKVMKIARNYYKYNKPNGISNQKRRLINSTFDLGGFYIYDNYFLSMLQVWEKDAYFRLVDFLVAEMEKQLINFNFNPDVFFPFSRDNLLINIENEKKISIMVRLNIEKMRMILVGNDRIRFENLLAKHKKNVTLYFSLFMLSLILFVLSFYIFGKTNKEKELFVQFYWSFYFMFLFAFGLFAFSLTNIFFDKIPKLKDKNIDIYVGK